MRNFNILIFHALLVLFSIVGFNSATENEEMKCKERERRALLKFKQSLQDESGMLSTWKDDPNADCCKWKGVQCNYQTGYVQRLDLHGSKRPYLSGEINPSITELQHLKYLDLSHLSTSSQIPKYIGSFSNLRYLDLSYGRYYGKIPSQIGNLSQLPHLDLSVNDLIGVIPFQLGNLSLLQSLKLGFNYHDLRINDQSRGNADWLSNLSSLRILDLSKVQNLNDSSHDTLKFLRKIPILEELYLYGCSLSDANMLPLYDSHLNFSNSLTLLDISENLLTSSMIFPWMLNYSSNLQHLDLSNNLLSGTIPDDFGNIVHSLVYLDLYNRLQGKIPKSIGNVSSLQVLSLRFNQISGMLPDLSILSSLRELYLGINKLSGEIPTTIGSLTELTDLELYGNSFEGMVGESHFTNLSKLKHLYLSDNLLTVKVSDDWVPPFQLQSLGLSSCNLNSRFPNWLQTQNNLSQRLDISNNNLTGKIPNLELNLTNYPTIIDLSSNQLEGSIPPFLLQAKALYLSNNKFSDLVPFLCNKSKPNILVILDLSNNELKGELPDCWNNLTYLHYVDLSNNKLSGNIPYSMGALSSMEALILRNNSLSGQLSSSLKNCSDKLALLDLGQNKFHGPLPSWIGDSLHQLVILSLRFNNFNGNLPSNICYLIKLHVLDMSLNNFSGGIPLCVKNFTSMAQNTVSSAALFDHVYFFNGTIIGTVGILYDFDISLMWKGVDRHYKNADKLLKSIDLSGNQLTGEIPTEMECLFGLISLNLSRNNLTGEIPSNIGYLKLLEVLDLSRNHLSGTIPSSLAQIYGLSTLNLSNNELDGKIPIGSQMHTFEASSFEGNSNLCGQPLHRKCPGEELTEHQKPQVHAGDDDKSIFLEALYMSMGIGFFTGFVGLIGSILLLQSWRDTYSRFLNALILRIFRCWKQ
ncbi:receptor protein EIX2 [Trifolium repens]|nr:receptor protein EIX2 [Trifolium repens]